MSGDECTEENRKIMRENAERFQKLIQGRLIALLKPEVGLFVKETLLSEDSEQDPYDHFDHHNDWLITALLDEADCSRGYCCDEQDLIELTVQEEVLEAGTHALAGGIMTVWLQLFKGLAEKDADDQAPEGRLRLSGFDDRMLQPGLDEKLWLDFVDQVTIFGDPREDDDYSETIINEDQLIELFVQLAADLPPGQKISDCARRYLEAEGVVIED